MSKIAADYPFSHYSVTPPEMTDAERRLVRAFTDIFLHKMSAEEFCKVSGFSEKDSLKSILVSMEGAEPGMPLSKDDHERFVSALAALSSKFGVADGKKVAREVASQVFGYKLLQPLFDDQELEEIIINGAGIPVLVYHREKGICITDLSFSSEHELSAFLTQAGASQDQPFQDLMLPDGNRAHVAMAPPAVHSTVTIRKFRFQPMSVVDLVMNNTLSTELAGFLWVAADGLMLYPLNMLVVGGTASGKTTTLNALSVFIPPHERIVSIEDTQELNFSHRKNWVALEANRDLSLNELLRNSLRMRPDRLIVGEVRGPEAETLFTAMNVGHRGTMGTLHSNSDHDAVKRLENPPMNVPVELIPLADLIVVQQRFNHRKKGMVRRVVQVSEVTYIENHVAVNEIFKWDSTTDSLVASKGTTESKEKLARATSQTINQVSQEIDNRSRLIELLVEKNVSSQKDIALFMNAYYREMFRKGGFFPYDFDVQDLSKPREEARLPEPAAKPEKFVRKSKDGIELVG